MPRAVTEADIEFELLEFEQVVHCADQAPFAVRSSVSAKSEFAEPQVGFDVAENGLDTDAAFAVERGVLGLRKLVIHHISGDRGINDVASDMREHRFNPRY